MSLQSKDFSKKMCSYNENLLIFSLKIERNNIERNILSKEILTFYSHTKMVKILYEQYCIFYVYKNIENMKQKTYLQKLLKIFEQDSRSLVHI